MRRPIPPVLLSAFVAATLAAAAPAGVAGESAGPTLPALGQTSDPCGFYRGQAFGRGLDHFLTEMLWACEAVATRRGAGMPLSERLAAVEGALERYRAAVIAAGAADFARARTTPPGALRLGTADAVKATLADSTGAMAALEAIRTGF